MKPQVSCVEAGLLCWMIAGYVQGHLTATQSVLYRRSAADLIPFLHERDLYYRRSDPVAAQGHAKRAAPEERGGSYSLPQRRATQSALCRRRAADLIPFLQERDLHYRRSDPAAAQCRRRIGARRPIRTTGGRIRRRRSGSVGCWS